MHRQRKNWTTIGGKERTAVSFDFERDIYGTRKILAR